MVSRLETWHAVTVDVSSQFFRRALSNLCAFLLPDFSVPASIASTSLLSLAFGRWSLSVAFGYWLLAFDFGLLAFDGWLLAFDFWQCFEVASRLVFVLAFRCVFSCLSRWSRTCLSLCFLHRLPLCCHFGLSLPFHPSLSHPRVVPMQSVTSFVLHWCFFDNGCLLVLGTVNTGALLVLMLMFGFVQRVVSFAAHATGIFSLFFVERSAEGHRSPRRATRSHRNSRFRV